MPDPKNIAGYKTKINAFDVSTPDASITITPEGDVSQTIKNNPEQYYGASVFGYARGAQLELKEAGGTKIQTIVADISSNWPPAAGGSPYITFETTCLNDEVPSITLYWTATSQAPDTVFATGSCKVMATPPGSAYNWAMTPSGTINCFYFEPQTNFTKAYVGGSFTDLGKYLRPGKTQYKGYGTVNLTGGQDIVFNGKSGQSTNFGPLGSAISATPADNSNGGITYYGGGYGGVQIEVPSASEYINKILEITSSDNKTFVCLGGAFTSLNVGISTTKGLSSMKVSTTNLFIFEKYAPRNWCRFIFPGVIYDMDHDTKNNVLLIGSNSKGGITPTMFVLSGLSGTALAGVQAKVTTASGAYISKISGLKLAGNPDPNVPLWSRFQPDKDFNINVNSDIVDAATEAKTTAAYKLKYFTTLEPDIDYGVVFAGGGYTANDTDPIKKSVGFTCHYCGSPNPNNSSNRGRRVDKLPSNLTASKLWSPFVNFGGTVSDILIESRSNGEKVIYVCGSFAATGIKDENGALFYNKTYGPNHIVAFDLGKSIPKIDNAGLNYKDNPPSVPSLVRNWRVLPDALVASMALDTDGEEDVLYVMGDFTKITTGNTAKPRNYLAALNTADVNGVVQASLYGWNVALDKAMTLTNICINDIYSIPNTSPLSGLLIVNNSMTKIDSTPVNKVARVVKHKQTIANFQEKAVTWQLGSKLLNGSDLTITSEFISVSTVAKQENEVIQTTFGPEQISSLDAFAPDGEGELKARGNFVRFLITPKQTTPNNSSEYAGRTWIIGAKIDHNPFG